MTLSQSRSSGKQLLYYLNYTGFVLIAFACFLSPPIVSLGSILLLVVFLADARSALNDVWSTQAGKFLLAFLLYLFMNACWGVYRFGHDSSQVEQGLDYLYLLLFVIPGWLAYRYSVNWKILFVIWIIGILASVAHVFYTGDYERNVAGLMRFTINKSVHPIQAALYLSVAIVGLCVTFFSATVKQNRSLKFFVLALCLVLGYLFVLANSRGPMLGLSLALLALLMLWFLLDGHRDKKSKYLLLLGVVGLVALVVSVLSLDSVKHRFAADAAVYQDLMKGDIQDMPYSSAGSRIYMLKFGFSKLMESPFTGYGPYVKYLIDESNLQIKFGHLHNVYLEILLRFGLIGFIMLMSVVFLMFASIVMKYREEKSDDNHIMLMFVVSASICIGVWGMIDYRLTSWENTAFFWLFLGYQFSQTLQYQRLKQSRNS